MSRSMTLRTNRVRGSGRERGVLPRRLPAGRTPMLSKGGPGTSLTQATAYALGRLTRELSPSLVYHSLEHTRNEVLPAADWLAAESGLSSEDRSLLLVAACFHDLGFVERYEENERLAACIAGEVLPGFGYGPRDVEMVTGMILATRLPQDPHTLLEQILVDADLDVLGRDDFLQRNADLRREQATYCGPMPDGQWYTAQLNFIRSHRYFTPAAERLRGEGKRRNIRALEEMCARCGAQC